MLSKIIIFKGFLYPSSKLFVRHFCTNKTLGSGFSRSIEPFNRLHEILCIPLIQPFSCTQRHTQSRISFFFTYSKGFIGATVVGGPGLLKPFKSPQEEVSPESNKSLHTKFLVLSGFSFMSSGQTRTNDILSSLFLSVIRTEHAP